MAGIRMSGFRTLALALLALGLLMVGSAPPVAAEDHSHCEQASEAHAEHAVVASQVSIGAEMPCHECPDSGCAVHPPCSAGHAPALGILSQAPPPPRPLDGAAPGYRQAPGTGFDPSPPTPPPNGLTVP